LQVGDDVGGQDDRATGVGNVGHEGTQELAVGERVEVGYGLVEQE
jgi:hypothetical protein